MQTIKGLYTALITPFLENGELDEEGFIYLIERQMEAQVDGIVVLGTTGEAPTLTSKEKEKIISLAIKTVNKKIPVMVGTGSYSTVQTIESTKQAQDLGADLALIVVPYYNKPTQEGLYRHYATLHDAVDFPLVVYNIVGRSSVNLQTETLQRITALPNIIGVKEASGQLSQIMEIIEMISPIYPQFSVMSGDDQFTFPVMCLGGSGVISVASNLIPYEMKQLVSLIQQGQYAEAKQLHYALSQLFKTLFIETNPIPIKAAMSLSNLPAGPCRLPLCELQPSSFDTLKKVLAKNLFLSFKI